MAPIGGSGQMLVEHVAYGTDHIAVRRPVDDGTATTGVCGAPLVKYARFGEGREVITHGISRQASLGHDVLRRDLAAIQDEPDHLDSSGRRGHRGARLIEARGGGPIGHPASLRSGLLHKLFTTLW